MVVIEDVATVAGDVNIGPTLIVKIGDGAAHGETRSADASFVGDIGERAVVIVAIERALGLFSFESHFHGGSVREVDIEPAVTIVVEKQDAAAHRLDDVTAIRRRGKKWMPAFSVISISCGIRRSWHLMDLAVGGGGGP